MQTADNSGTQARVRELEPLLNPDFQPSLRDYLEDFFIRFHFGASLLMRQLV